MNNISLVRNILNTSGQFTLPLKGNSMQPTYFEGDSITIVPANNINIGDLVLFESNNNLVLHRVIECYDDYFITKGDNHPYCDDMITRSQILGKGKSPEIAILSNTIISRQFIIGLHNQSCSENTKNIIGSSNILLEHTPEIKTGVLNIGIVANANATLREVMQKSENYNGIIKLHFNIKFSNHVLEGYFQIEKFDYIARPTKLVTSALLSIEQQIIMTLGILNEIGDV